MITEDTRRDSNLKTDKKIMEGHVLRVLQTKDLPVTAREIAVQLFHERVIPYPERSIIQPRLTELAKEAKVVVVGKKKDPSTNRTVATYILGEV